MSQLLELADKLAKSYMTFGEAKARAALAEEVQRLEADAERYRAIRDGLEIDYASGIVVSLIDDFGVKTLGGEKADAAIDAAIAAMKGQP